MNDESLNGLSDGVPSCKQWLSAFGEGSSAIWQERWPRLCPDQAALRPAVDAAAECDRVNSLTKEENRSELK